MRVDSRGRGVVVVLLVEEEVPTLWEVGVGQHGCELVMFGLYSGKKSPRDGF